MHNVLLFKIVFHRELYINHGVSFLKLPVPPRVNLFKLKVPQPLCSVPLKSLHRLYYQSINPQIKLGLGLVPGRFLTLIDIIKVLDEN